MVRVYYYLFYRLYAFTKRVRTGQEEWTAMLFVSILLGFNLLTILPYFLDMEKLFSFLGSTMFGILAVVPLALINYFVLLHQGKAQRIINKFEQESKSQKLISSILTLMYVVLTLALAHR